MESAVTAFIYQTLSARSAEHGLLFRAEQSLTKALEEVERCRCLSQPIRGRIAELDFGLLAAEWISGTYGGSPIVMSIDESHRFLDICELLHVEPRPTLYQAELSARLSSRFTISDDCGPDEVGWDEPDEETTWTLRTTGTDVGRKIKYDDCVVAPGLKDLGIKDLTLGKIKFDGDHHGLWASVAVSRSVQIYYCRPPTLYVRFLDEFDEHAQKTHIYILFARELASERDVDVSFLADPASSTPTQYEGVLLPWGGEAPRYANEKDVEDHWPADGDWFWTWSDLADEYAHYGLDD
jgi:hypothetical protein